MGFFRIAIGRNIIGIETKIIWATPGTFTTVNYHCYEDGKNCGPTTQKYVDPFKKEDRESIVGNFQQKIQERRQVL
jgi:hypothetical protein